MNSVEHKLCYITQLKHNFFIQKFLLLFNKSQLFVFELIKKNVPITWIEPRTWWNQQISS